MIPSRRDDKGAVSARVSSPDEYATRAQDFFSKEGFFENSVANHVEEWDHIAHVWSTYESRHAKGEKPFARGINSFQLINDGSGGGSSPFIGKQKTPTISCRKSI